MDKSLYLGEVMEMLEEWQEFCEEYNFEIKFRETCIELKDKNSKKSRFCTMLETDYFIKGFMLCQRTIGAAG